DFGAPAVFTVPGRIIDHNGRKYPANFSQLGQPAEKGRHSPELVLAPGFVGVIVTLGAIQTATQEHPDLLGHDALGTTQIRAVVIMTARTVEALRCNPLAGHLIVGLISSDALPNPFPVRFRVQWKAVFIDDTEKIGKTPSPVIRVFRRVEKCLDQS